LGGEEKTKWTSFWEGKLLNDASEEKKKRSEGGLKFKAEILSGQNIGESY